MIGPEPPRAAWHHSCTSADQGAESSVKQQRVNELKESGEGISRR
jgi:hypothetical protein